MRPTQSNERLSCYCRGTNSLRPWRQKYIDHASESLNALTKFWKSACSARKRSHIRYASSLEGKGDLSEYERLIAERLKTRVQAELVSGHSLIGIHRDDLEITFDGRDIRKYGSSGQQRSAFLLLLLATISVFFATRNEYPLFLIDDIDSELDHERIGRLLEFLNGKTQTIVTTSKSTIASDSARAQANFR
jgi:DNA replication and repair protein RecF